MDITDNEDLGSSVSALNKKTVTFPEKVTQRKTVEPLLEKLDKDNIRANLEKFTSFHTRYYNSQYGRESSEWLLNRINETAGGLEGLELAPFKHR